MTKFQALYVLWLRHKSLCDCSWRALAGNYYSRYTFENKLIPYNDRILYKGGSGNQIDGIELEREAFKILHPNPLYGEPWDLYECDLEVLDINLKKQR